MAEAPTQPSGQEPGVYPSLSKAEAGSPFYKRVVLKVSGEGFCQSGGLGIDGEALQRFAGEIAAASRIGTQVGVVVGGGNIVRGAPLAQQGLIPQATADHMGMLGTLINGLALREALEQLGQHAVAMSSLSLPALMETYERRAALTHLKQGTVVIFAGGTGNPFFTTDTAAALRAAEMQADALLKATKVDGIYDRDPLQDPNAQRYDKLTFQQALQQRLRVMDMTALSLCMESDMPVVVFDMKPPGRMAEVVRGHRHGTRVLNDWQMS